MSCRFWTLIMVKIWVGVNKVGLSEENETAGFAIAFANDWVRKGIGSEVCGEV